MQVNKKVTWTLLLATYYARKMKTSCLAFPLKSTARQVLCSLLFFVLLSWSIAQLSKDKCQLMTLPLQENKSGKAGGWGNWHPLAPKSLRIIQRVHWCASYLISPCQRLETAELSLHFNYHPSLLLLVWGYNFYDPASSCDDGSLHFVEHLRFSFTRVNTGRRAETVRPE